MKKFISIIVLICLFAGCYGCQTQVQTDTNKVNFYYRAKQPSYGTRDGIYFVEEREISYAPTDYQQLIEEYLRGARMDECISPFPPGTTLVKISQNFSELSIELSPHMAFQSNADMIVCCACLCTTLFNLSDLTTITFSIENREINGAASITFDRNSFVNWDTLS